MRTFISWISLLILSWSVLAWPSSDINFSGFISYTNNEYFIQPQNERQKLKINANDPLVRARLHCLNHGDNLSGTGTAYNGEMNLKSIDYVGLTSLIGVWKSSGEVYKFTNIDNFYFWTYVNDSVGYKGPFNYRYALSPYGDDPAPCKWKVFIVNPTRVVLGSLQWSTENELLIELYDPDTGEITANKKLTRSLLSKIKSLNLPKTPILNESWKP